MFTKERKDGTYIRNINLFTQISPYVKSARTDSVIIFEDEYDITNTLNYIREKNVSFMNIFLYAMLRVITIMPKTNRFISGLRLYQRNRIIFSFPKNTDTNETENTVISFSPLLTFEKFCNKIHNHSPEQKIPEKQKFIKFLPIIQKMPRFIIRFFIWGIKFLEYHNGLPSIFTDSLPYFSSVIITNTDNLQKNIDAIYYHNFEIGTCGIFCTLGKIRENNEKKKIKIRFSCDARTTTPDYFTQSLNLLRELTEDPLKLEILPEWTTEQFVKLGLTQSELNNI